MTSQALISKIHCSLSADQKRDSELNVQQFGLLCGKGQLVTFNRASSP